MLTDGQRDFLLTQIAATRRLLDATPETYYGERMGLEDRLAELQAQLETAPATRTE